MATMIPGDDEIQVARREQLERYQHVEGHEAYCYFCGGTLEAQTTVTVRRPAFPYNDEPAVDITACLSCWRADGTGEMVLSEVEGEFIPLSSRATTVR